MSKGTLDILSQLKALASQGVGSVNGTGIDVGKTALIRARAWVTVVGGSGTLTLKLQGSATLGGTYYDIPGSNFLDPSDGAAIDAVGDYEVYIQTNFRFVRYAATVGTAAITWGLDLNKV